MRFSDGFLDEIRQRLPISQVVGEHVIWDKRKSQPGSAAISGPAARSTARRRPSFHADDRKGIYHCFGCGVTGDHFRFLTEKAGMSFPEAVEKLAGMAGVPMPARDEREEAREEARRSLYDVMELATQYFEAALAHNIGARARGYLFERGVSRAERRRGSASALRPTAATGSRSIWRPNGVSAQDMIDTGLVAIARRRSAALRPVPQPRDVPDHGFPRPDHRLRRPGADRRTCRPNISTRPRPSSSRSG